MRRWAQLACLGTGIAVLAGWAPWAWAQDPIHKMGRGMVNLLTGWIELPKQFHAGAQEDNPVVGIGRGVWNGVGQTVGGALHAVTFPLTMIDVPLPEGGTDLLQ